MDVLKTKKIIIRLFFALIVTTLPGAILSGGNWLIYYRPAYEARVVDFDTQEPIEGAVVVAIYYDRTYWFVQSLTGVSGVSEVVTDKDGNFVLPPMVSLLFPLTKADFVKLTFYKPGFSSIRNYRKEKKHKGPRERIVLDTYSRECGYAAISHEKIELQKVDDLKQRECNMPSVPARINGDEAPILYQYINEERSYLGFGGTIK